MPQESEAAAPRPELPMRLTRLRVKNFRSIADIDIPLSPLTVLVGPNGSGKSNVVDALRFVRDVFARGLDQAVMDREGMGVIQRWGTEGEGITIGVNVTIAHGVHSSSSVSPEESSLYQEKRHCEINYCFTFFESVLKEIIIKDESIRFFFNDSNAQDVFLKKEYDDFATYLSSSLQKKN